MQRAISILLIMCLTVQTFNRLSIITSYELNKDFITEAFCINQATPELHCEGKCYLTKQLAQADQQEQNATTDIRVKYEVLYFQDIFTLPLALNLHQLKLFAVYVLKNYRAPVFAFFTPPKF